MTVNDALLEDGSIRLRPILMTTLAVVFGMMPLALGRRLVVLVYIDRVGLWARKHLRRSADDMARLHKPAE
jgi:hydrophobic/amphiphilic exporter-1 (mainly G- bacteria), HAE1 family